MAPNSRLNPPLEIWAGIECTINRVGDRYFDQCERNGHRRRPEDLRMIRDLGITTLRYPFLWEHSDWDFFDQQIAEMQTLGIRPIAGLLHHGSGPKHTHLLDPEFPKKFAEYAEAFAKRYPFIEDYTPVNEPLTTARFSGLYGVWYPHGKSDREFLRALIHQIKATILAMSAIRKINPRARLIQTEDLGRATGTPALQYQVDFENERRWLSIDLLCGRVKPGHALYDYLIRHGVLCEELAWIEQYQTPPDLFGINHYLLSNRFLDDELQFYPTHLHGGNGRDRYADVGAVDWPRATPVARSELFAEAWQRYQIPLAITEIHASGKRESQLRWFHTIIGEVEKARAYGADLRAVTAWSVFGSHDWNSLCTRESDYYESGVFDVSDGKPRPTAIANYLKNHRQQEIPHHPLVEQPGWWDRTGENLKRKIPSILLHGKDEPLALKFVHACLSRKIGVSTRAENAWASVDFGDSSAGDHCDLQNLKIVPTPNWVFGEDTLLEIAHHCLDILIDGESGEFQVNRSGNLVRMSHASAESHAHAKAKFNVHPYEVIL